MLNLSEHRACHCWPSADREHLMIIPPTKWAESPFHFDSEEIAEWSERTQALARLSDAHFAVFNAMEAATSKRLRNRYQKALGTLWRAAEYLRQEEPITDEQYRHEARGLYLDEGTIEIDSNAKISRGDDNGAYVEAWVWVSDGDLRLNLKREQQEQS